MIRREIMLGIEKRIKKSNKKFNDDTGWRASFEDNGDIYLKAGRYTIETLNNIIQESLELKEYLDQMV